MRTHSLLRGDIHEGTIPNGLINQAAVFCYGATAPGLEAVYENGTAPIVATIFWIEKNPIVEFPKNESPRSITMLPRADAMAMLPNGEVWIASALPDFKEIRAVKK